MFIFSDTHKFINRDSEVVLTTSVTCPSIKTARIVPCSTINSRGSVTTAIVVFASTYSHTLTKTAEAVLIVTR